MKRILCVFCFVAFANVPLLAGEFLGKPPNASTKIIGGVSDGKPSPSFLPKVLPQFTINWSMVHQKKDHKVIINKVQAPVDTAQNPAKPLNAEETDRSRGQLGKWISDVKESGGFFTVSATIYDHKTTHVRWWYEGKEYAVYSNVDWNHLGGFHEFEGRGKRYNMFLLSGNVDTEQLQKEIKAGYRASLPDIPRLPLLAERGAAYMVMKGDEENDAAMEFIEAIHDLYDEHRPELMKAWRERKKNHHIYLRKQEELRLNPPPKKDIIINYWKKKTPIAGKEAK